MGARSVSIVIWGTIVNVLAVMSLSNHYLDRAQKRRDRAGLAAEEELSKVLGARINRGSGAVAWRKGDMQVKQFKLENKSTQKKSLSIKKAWMDKITDEALSAGDIPALGLVFTDDQGRPDQMWVAVPAWVFKEMIDGC